MLVDNIREVHNKKTNGLLAKGLLSMEDVDEQAEGIEEAIKYENDEFVLKMTKESKMADDQCQEILDRTEHSLEQVIQFKSTCDNILEEFRSWAKEHHVPCPPYTGTTPSQREKFFCLICHAKPAMRDMRVDF